MLWTIKFACNSGDGLPSLFKLTASSVENVWLESMNFPFQMVRFQVRLLRRGSDPPYTPSSGSSRQGTKHDLDRNPETKGKVGGDTLGRG